MKQDFTVFVCDTCNKQETMQIEAGFPYEKGWVYLYKFNGQILQLGRKESIRFDLENGHFCSDKCTTVKLAGLIREAKTYKEEIKEPAKIPVQEQPATTQDNLSSLEEFPKDESLKELEEQLNQKKQELADAPVYVKPLEKPSFINTVLRRGKHDKKPAEGQQPSQP